MKTNEPVNLELIVSELNVFGLYNCKLFVLLGFCSLFSAAYSTNYIFTAENISYRCKYTECAEEMSLAPQVSLDLRCTKYETSIGNGTCFVQNTDVFEECGDWVYEESNSFVEEFHLACQEWKRTLIGTLHSAGFMTGLFIVGPISDRFGRKKVIIFGAVAAGILGVAKSFVTSYWLYATLEYIEPLIGDCYSATHTMAVEMVTKEYRSLAMGILSLCTGIGGVTKAIVAWLTPNWRVYLRVIYGPALLFIVYIYLMDDSLRWLLNKGKKDELKRVVKKIADTNKVSIDDRKIDSLQVEEKVEIKQYTLLKMTLKSKKLIARTLCCIMLWFSTLFGSYSLAINSVSLKGNRYLNYGLLALSDIPASFILYFLLEKCKRRVPIIAMLMMTSVCCMGSTFTPADYQWLSTLLYITGRMCVAVALRIVYLYTSELFPTHTRNTMHSWCSGLGRVAGILAPQTPLLIPFWVGFPALLVGMLALLTACVMLFMPDTSDDVLPDSIKQAESLGGKNNEKQINIYSISSRL